MKASSEITAAFYVIPGRHPLVRLVNLLHWPYTLWHLSYVAIGASLAPGLDLTLLGWTVLAFFLGMGVASHCFDLMAGDPLGQGFSRLTLTALGAVSLVLACGIGLGMILLGPVSPWVLLAVPLGAVFAVGYGLEWGPFHGDQQFALWWGVFPLLVGYFIQDPAPTLLLVPAAAFAYLTAAAQRELSTRARFLRRRVSAARTVLRVEGEGVRDIAGRDWPIAPIERALKLLSFALPSAAAVLVLL